MPSGTTVGLTKSITKTNLQLSPVSYHSTVAQYCFIYHFLMAQKPLVGQGLLSVEASRLPSDTPHSVGLLWMSDQPDLETST
jgi:hypothetical protein